MMKYRLTGETKLWFDRTLYRIRALSTQEPALRRWTWLKSKSVVRHLTTWY